MGNTGIVLLSIALLGLIITSLIGNLLALSRLFYALGKDRILPERFSALGKHDIPVNAILLVAGISFFIPFFGRTAIGWIVDVTTIGATIIYAMVASSAWKTAHKHGALVERWVAFAGLLLMIAFGLYLLIPNLIQESSMEKESYFLFIAWGLLGFLFFRYILHNDEERRFGKSVVVWIGLF
jgi:amino acid transporter